MKEKLELNDKINVYHMVSDPVIFTVYEINEEWRECYIKDDQDRLRFKLPINLDNSKIQSPKAIACGDYSYEWQAVYGFWSFELIK